MAGTDSDGRLDGHGADGGEQPSAPNRRKVALAGGLWLAASQFIPFFATAVLSVVAGRLLGAERLGTQSLIAFSETLVSAIIVQTLTTAAIRTIAAAHGRGSDQDLAAMNWWVVRAHLVLGVVAAGLLGGFAALRADGEFSWWLVVGSVLANAAGWAYGAVAVGNHGWGRVGRVRLVSQLGAAVLAIGALLAGGGIEWIFLANILASLWVAWVIRKEARGLGYTRASRPLPGFWNLYLLLGLGEVIAQVVVRRSEFFILDRFSTESEIAMYSIAFMLVAVATSIPQSLGSSVMPEVARSAGAGDYEGLNFHLGRALRVTALFSLPLAGAMIAVGPDLVSLVYGEDYRRAGYLTAFAAVGVLTLPVLSLCQEYWSGRGQLKPVLLAGAAAAVVDIVVALALIPSHGAAGAVTAKLCGQFALGAMLVTHTWREHDHPRILTPNWLIMASVTGVAGAASWFLSHGLGTLLACLVAGVTYLAVLLVGMIAARPLHYGDAAWLAGVLPASAHPALMRFARSTGRHARL